MTDDGTARNLCSQCAFLFSTAGIRHLLTATSSKTNRSVKLRHSLLETFPDRIQTCRFCRYLWEEDLIGASPLSNRYRRLRDLVDPAADVKKFVGSWVVIGNAGKLGSEIIRGEYLEKNAGPDGKFGCFKVGLDSAKGKLLWEFPLLNLVTEAGMLLLT